MLYRIICTLFLAAGLAACQAPAEEAGASPSEASVETTDVFGQAVTAEAAIAYAELPARLEGADSMRVKVAGTVDAVCQAKGCWLTMTAEGAPEMMVKFKDYGFFVPKDIAGRQVVLEGTAYYAVTPVDELRHLAEDAGKPQAEIDAITEPETTLNFVADGVLLLPQG